MITFITSLDFAESAKSLDKRRLWKQVLEAKQLLERIRLIRTLARYYGLKVPDKHEPAQVKYDFIRVLMSKLKRKQMTPVWTEDGTIDYEPRKPGIENRIKLGHIYHPIVPLWIGYTDVLKHYIHVHHIEWRRRGVQCKCVLEDTETKSPSLEKYPKWINVLIPAHKRILYTKSPPDYPQWRELGELTETPWKQMYDATN